ncbi:MAG: molecular chaperone DnaJ [Actinomycetota bacterium]|jgi:molecular chaperone DnaJ|nr:molecular chaperone DnaJ [Actinomycetota bacterium]
MSQREWADKDYYKVLGVSKDATKEQIKKAYRKLAQKYHPDANKGDSSAEARFKEISEAHSILSNDTKRREYDQMRSLIEAGGHRWYGYSPGDGGGNVRVDIGDLGDLGGAGLFDDLLGFGFRGAARGEDMETQIELSFEEAMTGTTVSLSQGGGRVRIPPGIGDGGRVRVSGKGGQGRRGAPPGDLYVRVRVKPHPIFERGPEGQLMVRVPVSITEAALGAKVEVPTLDGSVTVKIPAGTPNGKTLRVRGRGAATAKGGKGDLLVKVEVEVPQKLSKQERDLLEKFADVHKASPRAHLEQYLGAERAKAS